MAALIPMKTDSFCLIENTTRSEERTRLSSRTSNTIYKIATTEVNVTCSSSWDQHRSRKISAPVTLRSFHHFSSLRPWNSELNKKVENMFWFLHWQLDPSWATLSKIKKTLLSTKSFSEESSFEFEVHLPPIQHEIIIILDNAYSSYGGPSKGG